MWIDETYVGFNISKTAKVQNWVAYKWGEVDGSYYYFKKDGDYLPEHTAPEGWDGIDYSLNSSNFSTYENATIPSMYQIIYGEIISLMNSQLLKLVIMIITQLTV